MAVPLATPAVASTHATQWAAAALNPLNMQQHLMQQQLQQQHLLSQHPQQQAFFPQQFLPQHHLPQYQMPQYQFVVRECYGQPYVFAVPVFPGSYPQFAASQWVQVQPASMSGSRDAGATAGVAAQQQPRPAAEVGAGGAGRDEVAGAVNVDALKLLLKLVLFIYILGQVHWACVGLTSALAVAPLPVQVVTPHKGHATTTVNARPRSLLVHARYSFSMLTACAILIDLQDGGTNRIILLSIGAAIVFLGQVSIGV